VPLKTAKEGKLFLLSAFPTLTPIILYIIISFSLEINYSAAYIEMLLYLIFVYCYRRRNLGVITLFFKSVPLLTGLNERKIKERVSLSLKWYNEITTNLYIIRRYKL
jgi:hypothetical protein